MRVLLSIKPEFAELIFSGVKKYEFRKVIFKDPRVKTVVVYASYPTQKVVGEFSIDSIIDDEPGKVWRKTKRGAGIEEGYFLEYFANRRQAYAIKVKTTKRYRKPLCLRKDFKLTPPQSFMYLR